MSENDIERSLGDADVLVDTEGALARFRARVEHEGVVPANRGARRRHSPSWLPRLAAAAGVVLVASALALSPLADSILTIFEPKRIVSVPVSQSDLSYLGQACAGLQLEQCLGTYGTFTWTTPPQPREVRSLSEAAAAAGFAVQTPGSMPPSIVGQPRYGVVNRSSATFVFSADSTRQAAARLGRTPPPMPANIDGSKLLVTGGPAVVQVWGSSTTQAPGGTRETESPSSLATLVVGQAKAPTVASDGVTVDELRAYLLRQPGISPQLAAAIRAIGDPASTLPVPVPAELAISHPVTVQGVQGLYIGDNTGIASAVIWQKDGMMFEVIGSFTESQALLIANSMR